MGYGFGLRCRIGNEVTFARDMEPCTAITAGCWTIITVVTVVPVFDCPTFSVNTFEVIHASRRSSRLECHTRFIDTYRRDLPRTSSLALRAWDRLYRRFDQILKQAMYRTCEVK